MYPASDFDENDSQNTTVFNQNVQPGTSRAMQSTVILVDDPNNPNDPTLSPQSDGGEIRYDLRKWKHDQPDQPDSTEKPTKQKMTKHKSTKRKQTKQTVPPLSMSDICDKVTTCALEAREEEDDDENNDDFESDMFQSLEAASHYVPKRESDEETSLSDESLYNPKASTPK